ncbi:MAG: hypothetical protein A2Y10_16375 [Planctomycetes bacterium GWF2_41_51]|nr:MAG: hypothetical protein A2Y10_16375 [Planctomycetes bacterium GWF2_41_51]
MEFTHHNCIDKNFIKRLIILIMQEPDVTEWSKEICLQIYKSIYIFKIFITSYFRRTYKMTIL